MSVGVHGYFLARLMTQQIVNSKSQNHEDDSSLDLLTKLYQQSRDEGIQLIHSMLRDFVVIMTITAVIVGGGIVSQHSELLIIIPIFLGIYCNIILGKVRTNNLITSYMIYLERLINIKLGKAIVVWASIVRKNVSAGRQSKWGNITFVIGTLVAMSVFGLIARWIYFLNGGFFVGHTALKGLYFGLIGLSYIFAIYQSFSIYKITKKYTPEYIEKEVADYESKFIVNR